MYRTFTALALLSVVQISAVAAVPLYHDQQENTVKTHAPAVHEHASSNDHQPSVAAGVKRDAKTPVTTVQNNPSTANVSEASNKAASSMASKMMCVARKQKVFVDAQAGAVRIHQEFLPATTLSLGYFFTPRIALESAYTRVIAANVRNPELKSDYFSAGLRGFVLDKRIYVSTGAARSRYVDQVYNVAYKPYGSMGYQHAIAQNVWLDSQISHVFFTEPVTKLAVGVRWSNQ